MKTKIYKCEKCSTEVNDSQSFCHSCGSMFAQKISDSSELPEYEEGKFYSIPVSDANNVDEKEKIVQQLVKWGNNEEESKKMVEENYEYVSRTYIGASVKKKAEVIRTIG